ncbi:MAG: response regulator receiver protein [Verrucomicrobiales bacterium]|nr:response regulator receiver protein [Verrucomicrobiales bacterium]
MDDRVFILVAEDQPDDAFLFEHTFAGLGIVDYYISTTGPGTISYLDGAGQFSDRLTYPVPDCVLLDLQMPEVDGFQILEWMRCHQDYRLVPTVVFSSSGDPADIRRAYELGANSYFTKCVRIQDMIRKLSLIEEYWTEANCPKLNPSGRCVV